MGLLKIKLPSGETRLAKYVPGSGLPSGYTRLQWSEVVGADDSVLLEINLSEFGFPAISCINKFCVQLDLNFTTTNGGLGFMRNAGVSGSYTMILFAGGTSSNYNEVRVRKQEYREHSFMFDSSQTYFDASLYCDGNMAYGQVNNDTYQLGSYDTWTRNMYLIDSSDARMCAGTKLFGFQIYEFGTGNLIYKFIPALRKSDNITGFYEVSTDTFVYSHPYTKNLKPGDIWQPG